MKKNKFYIAAILLLISVVAYAAGVKIFDHDGIQIGGGANGNNKEFIFNTGDGGANKRIVVNVTTKDGSFNINNYTIGDGADTDKKYILDLGLGAANPFLVYNTTTDTWQFANTGAGSEIDLGPGSGGGAGAGSGVQLLDNPDFETPTDLDNWTGSNPSNFTLETVSGNVGLGEQSANWDAAIATETLLSDAITVPNGLKSRECTAEMIYNGGDANIDFQVFDGSVVVEEITLAVVTTWTKAIVYFICPSSGTIAIRLEATADAANIVIDDLFLGLGRTETGLAKVLDANGQLSPGTYVQSNDSSALTISSAQILSNCAIAEEIGTYISSTSDDGTAICTINFTADFCTDASFIKCHATTQNAASNFLNYTRNGAGNGSATFRMFTDAGAANEQAFSYTCHCTK